MPMPNTLAFKQLRVYFGNFFLDFTRQQNLPKQALYVSVDSLSLRQAHLVFITDSAARSERAMDAVYTLRRQL